MLQFDDEMKYPKETFLRRKVANLLPISFSTTQKLEKKKQVAKFVHGQVKKYEYKEVWREVGKRQDHQKYERQQARARDFLKVTRVETQEALEKRVETYYNRKNWDTSDIKKVVEVVCSILKENATRRLTSVPNSTGIRYKPYEEFPIEQQLFLSDR